MNIEEIKKKIDINFELFHVILFLLESDNATEKELLKIFPKSSQTLNRRLKDLTLQELVVKRKNLFKEKKHAHNIYSSTPKLYELTQYLSDSISKLTNRNQTISRENQDIVESSEA